MRKFLAVALMLTLVLSATACSTGDNADNGESSVQPTTTATEDISTAETEPTLSIEEQIDNILDDYRFEGVVYLTQNGKVLYQLTTGSADNGEAFTTETPIPVGSISKQFCSTAILMLRDQGKLSLDDTLDVYFPEYEHGKNVTLKHLLTMRSGITDAFNMELLDKISAENTEEENTDIIKTEIFSQPPYCDPDTKMSYSNSNYFLLGNIVEQVSGQKYMDFLRENIFTPLEMNHTGSVEEMLDSPEWANGVAYDKVEDAKIKGLTKGAGNIVSSAEDMDKWLTAIRSGKVISNDSYQEMITDYSTDYANGYCYGFWPCAKNGIGHSGGIGEYVAFDYFNEENDFNLFIVSNKLFPNDTEPLVSKLADVVID